MTSGCEVFEFGPKLVNEEEEEQTIPATFRGQIVRVTIL